MQGCSGGKEEGGEADVYYSQRLLSKDGPLGTVWLAAHFYRKLRKLHVTKTRIPSSVDFILQSDVPIALRLLGYLLIGIVRIYAKKVEYAYHDSNEALVRIKNSSTSGKTKHYKENSISTAFAFTVPERFELDSFNLEDLEERTHASVIQQVAQEDAHEDGANQSLPMSMMLHRWEDTATHSGFSRSMDVFSPEAMDIDLETILHRLSDAEASMEKLLCHKSPQEEILDIEMFCEPIKSCNLFQMHDSPDKDANKISSPEKLRCYLGEPGFLLSDDLHHLSNCDASWEELEGNQLPCVGYLPHAKCRDSEGESDKVEKIVEQLDLHNVLSVNIEETRISVARSPPSPVKSPIFHNSVVTPEVSLIPTPKINEQGPTPRKRKYLEVSLIPTPKINERTLAPRKKKCLFDGAVILSSEIIRNGLHDASSLLRMHKRTPKASVNVWNAHKVSIFQHSFLEPTNPYISAKLKAIFEKEYLHHQDTAEIGVHESATGSADLVFQASNKSSDDSIMLSNEALDDVMDLSPEEVPETIKEVIFETSSQNRRDEVGLQTCASPINDSFLSSEICTFPVDPLISPLVHAKNKEARTIPSTEIREHGAEGGILDIGLDLLDAAVSSNEDCQNKDWWSGRTRAVARFLQNSFLGQRQQIERNINITENMEGRSRRTCARLFYETLVLKSRGYIDVKQDFPYGDIILLATPLTTSI